MSIDPHLLSFGWRASTVEFRCQAIERVILAMQEHLDEPLSLEALAEIAIMSPYHFNRVFRQLTGIPPCQFLWALRLEAAKKLLLTTRLSVIDVCFEVGYNSLGTFTSRFSQLVGLPPLRLRRLAERFNEFDFANGLRLEGNGAQALSGGVAGEIRALEKFEGMVLVGLFEAALPQGRPVACTLAPGPGKFRIRDVPDGSYYVFAAGLPSSENWLNSLIQNRLWRGGAHRQIVRVHRGETQAPVEIRLRPWTLTDPPVLVALPLLLSEYLADATSEKKEAAGLEVACLT